jgi:two-component system chemotaxis response regulator CheB
MPADSAGLLARILARTVSLPVEQVFDGAPIRKGHIYIASPDRHLIVTAEGIRLGHGPRENMTRPSVDPMFRSAAVAFGPRVVGVVLSGCLNDGASGLLAIRSCGGIAVAQAEAEFPEMPIAASQATTIDYWALAGDLAPLIVRLTGLRPGPARPVSPELQLEVDIAADWKIDPVRLAQMAEATPLTCPQCDGVLSEIKDAAPLRYRCQTGHALTAERVLDAQGAKVARGLRVALRVMQERVELVSRMARDAVRHGNTGSAAAYERRATEYRGYVESLRGAVLSTMDTAPTGQTPADGGFQETS